MAYVGKRQPHKSRRTRVLDNRSNDANIGPGQYIISKKADRIKSKRYPVVHFNKAKRFGSSTTNEIANFYSKPIPLVIRPALGEQVLSTRATLGSATFGNGTRQAANISATRTGRMGMDSPGPVYHPQEDSRGIEKRYGLRPKFSARSRMLGFQNSVSSSISSSSSRSRPSSRNSPRSGRSPRLSPRDRFRERNRTRPATVAGLESAGSYLIQSKLAAEELLDIGYERPGTSFGKSRRPPLFSKDKASIPGPKYENTDTRSLSTDRNIPSSHFGTSTRDQRKRIRGVVDTVVDTDAKGTAGPGPGAYFTTTASIKVAEKNTRSGYGPAYTIPNRNTGGGGGGGGGGGVRGRYKKTRPTREEMDRWSKPLRTSFGRQIEGGYRGQKNSPRNSMGLSPRFGNVHGFSVGKR